jgi:hypothetical protein
MLELKTTVRRWARTFATAAALTAGITGLVFGCASSIETPPDEDDGSPTTGQGGFGGSGGGAGGSSLCAVDCSAINTPACLKSVCNDGSYQGVVGECVVVPDEGASCEDGMFCTIDDTCNAMGQCTGGPPNDCGMTPGQCKEIACDEDSDSCGEVASMPGAPCQDPANLCLKGSTCTNGLCIGGTIDDCFFFPVQDDCHVAVCDPADGMCHEQVGNEGGPCVDTSDLCTVNKTCAGGVCVGGQPKNCSQLTMGCVLGVCDQPTGQCVTQNLMNGDPCDDLNFCTSGELCNNGQCTGGQPVTQCVDNDFCCPMNCTAQNDLECNYPFGTAQLVQGGFVNVQYHLCGGNGTPGTCTAAAAQQTCQSLGLKVVSHASNGTSSVLSLGATSSCSWSVGYYTVNKVMPTTTCVVAISNLMWNNCCTLSDWHGNTLDFGAPNQTFGYVTPQDSGYIASNPNLSGATWGCQGLTQAAINDPGCLTQYVACAP